MAHLQSKQDEEQIPDGMVAIEGTSSTGTKYSTLVLEGEEEAMKALQARPAGIEETSEYKVHWPLGEGRKQTDSDTRKAVFVTEYELRRSRGIFEYKLIFHTDRSGYYYFTDNTGQELPKSVVNKYRDHEISYDSKDPTIVNVKWASFQ